MASVLRDAGTYFGLNGVELGVGESATADLPQPNPSLVTTTVYDGAALIRAMSRLMENAGKPIPKEVAKLPAMQIGDEGHFVFDRVVGLVREATVTRRVNVPGPSGGRHFGDDSASVSRCAARRTVGSGV